MNAAAAHGSTVSPFRQPRAVFAVAFACVVSFMGIGLVDPVLPAISAKLDATPSQVTLLFTSYLVITALAMLVVGWISSRIGAKRTMIVGLAVIVVFSALAGSAGSIGQIVGFRAGWGVGNALFIATSLAVIVASASGGFAGAIVLYESALGVGIACGPLLGGVLGEVSWRGPFYGVAVLMAIALLATVVLVEPAPLPARRTGISEPLRALRHRGLLTLSLTALCYNWGFFTMLGYAPFPMRLSAIQLGLVFTGWGVLVAIFAVFGAPRLQARLGLARTLYLNLALFAAVLLVIALWTTHRPVLIAAVIVTGVFIGVNNTLTTQAVMSVAPVERPIASSAYGFVRFVGGGLAPYVAGKLVDAFNVHVPFYLGAGVVALGIAILATAHGLLRDTEQAQATGPVADSASPAADVVRQPTGDVVPAGTIVAAVGGGPGVAERVTAAAGRLAGLRGATVDVVHVREVAIGPDTAIDIDTATVNDAAIEIDAAGPGEPGTGTSAVPGGAPVPVGAVTVATDGAQTLVRQQVERLRAMGVRAVGHVLPYAADHGAVGRLLAEHARAGAARTIVVGTPSHGGLAALMDASATRELWRHTDSNIVIVNPAVAEPDAVPAGRAAGAAVDAAPLATSASGPSSVS